jgi:hypothetical protein
MLRRVEGRSVNLFPKNLQSDRHTSQIARAADENFLSFPPGKVIH